LFIQPIFSGAAWAGSVLWAAAEVLVEHMLLSKRTVVEGKSVLELGCGLGIPGMICSLLGAKQVILSEQDQLVPLLVKNIESNFAPRRSNEDNSVNSTEDNATAAATPQAVALNWGVEEAELILSNRKGERFDVILICDCVFEPLYGDSWKLLCETLGVIVFDDSTEVLISCERRSEDAIDDFLAMLGEKFVIDIAWTNFEDSELDTLLQSSHVGGEKKPLRIFSVKRKME
jgi:predicted nicotinamide N-methyase